MLSVGLLGAVEARLDGEPVLLPAGKTTELLARLAVSAAVPVRVDTLLDDLWGVPTGRNTLQAKVSQLRRALRDREAVRALDGAYVLQVDPDAVDAARAVRLADAAAAAARAGDPAAALVQGRQGLALFRGDVLPAAGGWAAPHRTRLEEVRWSLVETLAGARVDLGAGADAVVELEGLVAEQPLREGLWAALITALYRAGRQSDALAAYERVRRHLADALGVDPGPRLRALELEVLQHSARLRADRRGELARPGNVGAQPSPLVGRREDVALVEQLLVEQRLVTLVGPAGVGKTRLATEAAARSTLPGGAWLVRLEVVDGSADLRQLLAETLQVTGGATALLERLDGAETLVVLDSCEHVVDGAAALLDWLLTGARRARVLATSQLPLGLEEEQVLAVAPLAPADAVRLFELRAQRHRRGFELHGQRAQLVAEVCGRLDHLPLAIELAAARVRSLPLEEIARRLDDRFALLRDPGSHAPARRRALDAAIGWSYELLFPDDQRALWALSCCADGASFAALEAVTAALGVPAAAVADTVTRLVDRSLVTLEERADVGARYRLLDSVRVFASRRLEDAGDGPTARAAHLRWYAARAADCAAAIRTADQPACLAFARAERADLDAAIAWGREHDPATAAAIGLAMAWTWLVLGDGTAGAARVRTAVAGAASERDRARGRLVASWLEASTGDLALAQADLDAATPVVEASGDPLLRADAHWHAAFLAIQQGRADAVRAASAAALAAYRGSGSDWSVASALLLSAYGALMAGDAGSALRDATEAQALLAPLGDTWGSTHAEAILGGVAQATGRLDDAAAAFERAADAAARLGFLGQSALHRASWARCLARAGDASARTAYEQALQEAVAVADGRLAASVRLHLARLLGAVGERDAALALLQENVRWYAGAGGGDLALLNQVVVAALLGDGAALTEGLAHARQTYDVESVVSALDGLARLAAESGDGARAAALIEEGDRVLRNASYLIEHTERYDAIAARQALG